MEPLSLQKLKNAVAGEYTAIRRVTRLEALGGKVFPPTYEGGQYATEERRVGGKTVQSVLLDSVPSQANRLELALLRAYDAGRVKMPILAVDFAGDGTEPLLAEVGRLTALEAPHRWCDAIFRDAAHDGTPFRSAATGAALSTAKAANATPVFEVCPTALIFGFWDSTGPRGGLGAKVQRAIVSEIVGYESLVGKKTSSRIDPLQIENNVDIYRKGDGWTFEGAENAKKVRPSEINHGNRAPKMARYDDAWFGLPYAD